MEAFDTQLINSSVIKDAWDFTSIDQIFVCVYGERFLPKSAINKKGLEYNLSRCLANKLKQPLIAFLAFQGNIPALCEAEYICILA